MIPSHNGYFCYVIECTDHSFYTGWTTNLAARFEAHCQKKGAKYTKSHPPLALHYFEECDSKQAACKREYEIKQYTHQQKRALNNN